MNIRVRLSNWWRRANAPKLRHKIDLACQQALIDGTGVQTDGINAWPDKAVPVGWIWDSRHGCPPEPFRPPPPGDEPNLIWP